MSFIFTFLAAMIVSMMLLPPLMHFAERFQFVDQPNPRKVHANPIPRIGGVAIGVALFVSILVLDWNALSAKYLAILAAGLVVLAVGTIDDRRELDYKTKFAAQIVAALIVVYLADIRISELTLPGIVSIPSLVSGPLTVFVIVALANAVALSDGLDGLAGGIVFICCAALTVLGYLSGNMPAALLAAALSGAIFGFLRFNTHPAVIFMGDSGSQFLGLMSAVLAIDVTQSDGGRIAATLPLLLLAVPVLDTMQVMVSRVVRGKNPFKPDKFHLHHLLLKLGFAHHHTVLVIYLVQCAFFLLAFFFRFETDLLIIGLFLGASALLLLAVHLPNLAPGGTDAGSWLQRLRLSRLSSSTRQSVSGVAANIVMLMIAAHVLLLFLAIGTADPQAFNSQQIVQVQQLALVLLAAVIASFVLMSHGTAAILSQTIGYVVAAMLAFTASNVLVPGTSFAYVEMGLLLVIGLGNVTWLLLGERRESQMTTLDVLILFGALVVPNLPALNTELQGMATLVLRLICLFYAVEVVAAAYRSRVFFRVSLVGCLVLLAVNRPFTELSSSLSSFTPLP